MTNMYCHWREDFIRTVLFRTSWSTKAYTVLREVVSEQLSYTISLPYSSSKHPPTERIRASLPQSDLFKSKPGSQRQDLLFLLLIT